jgi:hypothetical protein
MIHILAPLKLTGEAPVPSVVDDQLEARFTAKFPLE